MAYHFHYSRQGDIQRPVIVFLHGFMGSGEDFARIIVDLSDQFCCIAIDLPGHGSTRIEGVDTQYTMSATAQALVAWLDRHHIAHCGLVGYSMGGRLALYMALKFAERFSGTVLGSASPGLHNIQERQQRCQQDEQRAKNLEADFPAFLTQWYGQPLFQPLRHHPNFSQVFHQRRQQNPVELAKSLRYMGLGRQPSLWDGLAKHDRPLLLVVGDRDRKFYRLNQQMADWCPTAKLHILTDCGHAVHLEQPERFVEQVRTFFSDTALK